MVKSVHMLELCWRDLTVRFTLSIKQKHGLDQSGLLFYCKSSKSFIYSRVLFLIKAFEKMKLVHYYVYSFMAK